MTPAEAFAADENAERLQLIRERMEHGQALYVAGKYAEAAEVFEAGYKDHPYSAFLFNAGVCREKAGQLAGAIRAFELYLAADPRAPDAAAVRTRLEGLEAARKAEEEKAKAPPPPPAPDAPVEAPAAVFSPAVNDEVMKALVVIETVPPGAPVNVYQRTSESASSFVFGGPNEGWQQVAARTSPAELSLEPGRYHVVVEPFGEFNRSEADIDVIAGHVHHFQANLSQGAFMGFLRVSSNVPGASIHLDDPKRQRPAWGRAPHAELVSPGEHELLVEAPGHQPLHQKVTIAAGDQKEVSAKLERVSYGIARLDSNAPSVRVQIDGRPVGVWRQGESAFQIQLPAGPHRLLVSADDFKDLEVSFDVPAGQVLPLRAQMIPTYPRGAAWAQAIIGAGLVGASTFFGLESNRLHDELEDERRAGNLDPSDERITRGYWYAIGADAGFALGGIFGALATYNFVKDPYPESSLRKGARREFEDEKKRVDAPKKPEAR